MFKKLIGKVRCALSLDNWREVCSVRARMWRSDIFGNTDRNIHGIAKILRCKDCGCITGYITDGTTGQRVNSKDLMLMVPSLAEAYTNVKQIFTTLNRINN